jgi:hypothetical protein
MKLTVRLKKRWITSVLREADKSPHPMPWQIRKDRVPDNKPIALVPVPARSNRS